MDAGADRTIRWFFARSDVEAALRLAREAEIEWPWDYARKFWPQMFSADSYSEVYAEAGAIEAQVNPVEVMNSIKGYWRYQVARNVLLASSNVRNVLDFGCNRGLYAISLHNEIPELKWHCVDIDGPIVEQVRRLSIVHARNPQSFSFATGTAVDLPAITFDGAMVMETLEHVGSFAETIQCVESSVKKGGLIFGSLPSGPVEYDMWVEQPHRKREHLREITLDDFWEVFGRKPGVRLAYQSMGQSRNVNMQTACLFFTYVADHEPAGEINWARKLSLRGVPEVALPGEVL